MNKDDILARISREAQSYYLPAATALDAYVDILQELAGTLDSDDLEALIAIGTVLFRCAALDGTRGIEPAPRLDQQTE